MTLLELVMIVKNSGEILRTCLQQNKKFIDYWTIVDTGSTDHTPDIIREELKDIPGKLHFCEFTTFDETRNKAFDLAQKKCKFMIVLDDSYEIGNGNELRKYLQKSFADIINLQIGYLTNGIMSDLYFSARISKTSSNIRYMYRVHETLNIKKRKQEYEKKFYIIDHCIDEHLTRTKYRLQRDMEMLLLDHQDLPTDPRVVYYIARTFRQLGKIEEAYQYTKKLLEMTNIKEYTFYAEYNLILFEYEKNYDVPIYETKLLDLQKRFIDRAEPSYKLAASLYKRGNLKQLEKIMNNLIKIPMPQLGMSHLDFDVYQYSIPYLYVEIKFKLGKIDDGVVMLKQLLQHHPYDQKLLNMKYAVCDNLDKSSSRLAPKTLVIHTGKLLFIWDPSNPKKISGSEYMAMYLAKEFRDLGYRVFIFGYFDDKKTDYQTTIDGIQYIDTEYFSDFCLTYIIDELIVSRYIDNLVYYNNVKSVHLWLHDIVPIGNLDYFQMHKTKFKGIICISEWQKRNVVANLGIDQKIVYVSRNAIQPKRFQMEVERIPYRFIYTSDPSRGLDNFVEMIPWIKEKYPLSTFYIFGKSEQIDDQKMKLSKSMDYVFFSERVSQEQLVIELKKSDVWLYPTIFTETYCISAVEAMASGCLVATFNLAALKEIVADRGVLIPYGSENENRVLFDVLCKVMDDPSLKKEIIYKGQKWALKQDFKSLALEWKNVLFT